MNMGKSSLILLAGLLLAACNSTESALTVEGSKSAAEPVVAANPTAPAAQPVKPATPLTAAQQAAAISGTRLQFAPIIGAPVEQVTPLSRRLTLHAKEKNLTIFPISEKNVTHVLKGYFSLLNENNKLTVVYVFDVLDPAGNRLHRIQGQESTAVTSATASWEAIPASVMEAIADRTIDEFASWRGGSGA